jgi:hypothetical protein
VLGGLQGSEGALERCSRQIEAIRVTVRVLQKPSAYVVDGLHRGVAVSVILQGREGTSTDGHRCVGNRLAELQLRILWEELPPRHPVIEVLAPPRRTYSNFIHGMRSMPVRIPLH